MHSRGHPGVGKRAFQPGLLSKPAWDWGRTSRVTALKQRDGAPATDFRWGYPAKPCANDRSGTSTQCFEGGQIDLFCRNFILNMLRHFAVSAIGATILAAGAAYAAPTTFTFNASQNNQTSFSLTSGGITLSASNFKLNTTTGKKASGNSTGLALLCDGSSACTGGRDYNNFLLEFDNSVKLLSYNVGLGVGAANGTTTFSQGSSSSTQNNTNTLGPFQFTQFTNQFIASPNASILVSVNDSDGGQFRIRSLTVEQVTPPPAGVPGPLPLSGIAIAFGMSRRLRRRIQLNG